MVRIALNVSEETREKLIDLAGGERSMGEKLNELVAEEYARQTVTLEGLAKKIDYLFYRTEHQERDLMALFTGLVTAGKILPDEYLQEFERVNREVRAKLLEARGPSEDRDWPKNLHSSRYPEEDI